MTSSRLRRSILFSLSALLITVLGGCGTTPGPLRVMTYNVKHGQGMDGTVDLDRVAAVIAAADADVVALQEIDHKVQRSGGVDQAARLAQLAGYEHHAMGRFMDYGGGQYGMAILSRFPIEDAGVINLPPGKHEPRTALRTTIARPGGPIVLVGVHLDWLEDDTERFAQAQTLVASLADETHPLIVTGDFNDVPGSRTIELLDRTWTRLPKTNDPMTFPSQDPTIEIDLIYVSDPMTGHAWVVDERMASDHRPVVGEIDR